MSGGRDSWNNRFNHPKTKKCPNECGFVSRARTCRSRSDSVRAHLKTCLLRNKQ